MTGDRLSARGWVAAGAVLGLTTAIAYGIVELLLAYVHPWMLAWVAGSPGIYPPGQTAPILFGIYALTGLLAGAVAGFIGSRVASLRSGAIGLDALVALADLGLIAIVLAGALAAHGTDALGLTAVAASVVLAIAILLRRLRHPLVVAGILLGAVFLADAPREGGIVAGWLGRLGYLALLLGSCVLVARARRLPAALADGRRGREALAWIGAAAVCVIGAGFLGWPVTKGPRPDPTATPAADATNVLLITLDTVRADHLSLYGYERDTTPFLRELSRTATVYEAAIAPSDVTLASHASIFTGLYPRQHGAHASPPEFQFAELDERHRTLAEILGEAGYETMAVVANFGYLDVRFGAAQGFQHYDVRLPRRLLAPLPRWFLGWRVSNAIAPTLPRRVSELPVRDADRITREAIALLDSLDEDRFFLFLNYMDAHDPYVPPPPFDSRFPGRLDTFRDRTYLELYRGVLSGRVTVAPEVREHLVSQYDGAIAYLDATLERLLSALKERGMYDETLIVITSDHGEAFGERDLIGHNVSVYQDQVRVPLMIKWPGHQSSAAVGETVSLIDLFATILDAAGLESPRPVLARSLRNLRAREHVPIVSQSHPTFHMIAFHSRFDRVETAVNLGRDKLISTTNDREELFDLAADPGESVDLLGNGTSGDATPRRDELRAALEAWLTVTPPVSDVSSDTELDEDLKERLRALGYLK